MKMILLKAVWYKVIDRLEYVVIRRLLIIVYITQLSIAPTISIFPLNVSDEKSSLPFSETTRYTPAIDKMMQRKDLIPNLTLNNRVSDIKVKTGTAATIIDALAAVVYFRPLFSNKK